jgi:hypothetical protein
LIQPIRLLARIRLFLSAGTRAPLSRIAHHKRYTVIALIEEWAASAERRAAARRAAMAGLSMGLATHAVFRPGAIWLPACGGPDLPGQGAQIISSGALAQIFGSKSLAEEGIVIPQCTLSV